MNKYYNEFIKVLQMVKKNEVGSKYLNDWLIHNIECEYIYEIDDFLLSDIFFTLKHYAIQEEGITHVEIDYFNECLMGKRQYSLEEKLKIMNKHGEL